MSIPLGFAAIGTIESLEVPEAAVVVAGVDDVVAAVVVVAAAAGAVLVDAVDVVLELLPQPATASAAMAAAASRILGI
jgi:hypothetical protein